MPLRRALAEAIKKEPYDLILCGKQAVDDDMAQVGPILAEFLNLPHVTLITKLEISADKKKAKVEREVDGGKEVIEVELPAVFTCQKGLNEPRYASLPGIMKAKKKEVKAHKPGRPGPAGRPGGRGRFQGQDPEIHRASVPSAWEDRQRRNRSRRPRSW